MCLRPITIYNSAKRLGYGKPFKIEVPCGQCAECKQVQKSEYYFRSYYHSKKMFDTNGYILFVTLTYRNEDLPHISEFVPNISDELDFPCFRRNDWRKFIVNLRATLRYYGYDHVGTDPYISNLTHFMTSEYGTDPNHTHRPHYHVLFFVKDGFIEPLELSKYIDQCWDHGMTDGVTYKGSAYVLNHCFGKRFNSDEVHMRAVCGYVAKYVMKDSEFQSVVDQRIEKLMVDKFGEKYTLNRDAKSYRNKLKHEMCQFHLNSKGFGLSGIEYNSFDDIFDNKMKMPDNNAKHPVKESPLSGYLARKIFYQTKYDEAGNLYWVPNEIGYKWLLVKKLKSIEKKALDMENWINNFWQYCVHPGDPIVEQEYNAVKDEWISKTREANEMDSLEAMIKYRDGMLKLKGDRSWKDVVIYWMCYMGRIKTFEQLQRESKGIYQMDSPDVMMRYSIQDNKEYGVFPNYNTSKTKNTFQQGFVSLGNGDEPLYIEDGQEYLSQMAHSLKYGYDRMLDKYFGDFVSKWNKYDYSQSRSQLLTNDQFRDKFVINEDSCPQFHDLDKLYELYRESLQYKQWRKQDVFDYREQMQKNLKAAGFYTKNI